MRRALSLLLAIVMAFCLAVVPASAIGLKPFDNMVLENESRYKGYDEGKVIVNGKEYPCSAGLQGDMYGCQIISECSVRTSRSYSMNVEFEYTSAKDGWQRKSWAPVPQTGTGTSGVITPTGADVISLKYVSGTCSITGSTTWNATL